MQHLFRSSQQTHKRMQTIASLCMIVSIMLSVFAPLSALAAPTATVFAQGTTDYGDLPDTSASTATGDYQTLAANGGPSHGIAAILRMGAQIDGEADGQPNTNADGDDITGTPNDEDGVQFKTPLRPGAKTVVVIGLQQPFNSTVYVNGWIDFNQDGDFADAGEQIALDQASNNGAVRTDTSYKAFDFSIPTDAMPGFTYARFRVCTATGECNTPIGAATDGEVEDYRVQIQSVAQLGNYVWLDTSGDGVQQSGEPGVEGVLVKLYRASDGTLVDVTATDASGYYSFTSVLPATYYAQFVASSGYTFTTALQGGNPANDSDANQATGRTGNIVLAGGANDQTWDAGLVTTTNHLVVCEAIPFGSTEVYHTFSLPKFNPALGALTGIDINSYVGLRQWIGGENRAANAQTGRITTSSDAMLTLPDATTLNSAVGLNTGFKSYALYDGITDFSGSSSYSYDDWQYAFSAVSTSYATLADFIAASPGQTVGLPFETLSGFTVSGGGGNLAAAQATYALAGVCVNYSYIPATPSTITVIKNSTGGDGTFDFSSPDTELAAVSLTTVGGTASSTVITKTAGTYTLTEDVLSGWQLTNISFSGDTIANSTRDNGSRQAIIRLDAGESITVTYTNAKIDLLTPVTGVLTVTKTIVGDGTGPFNLTIDGPSGYVTTTTINGGQTKVITGLVSGLYTVTETSPGAGWTTTYTATTGYSTGSSAVVTLTNSITATTFAETQITGRVFRDFNSDGQITANGVITDTGVQSVTVTAYGMSGASCGSTQSGVTGFYTLTTAILTCDGPYRIEFSNLPAGYEPATHGTQNGTSVQFVNSAAQATNVNLGVSFPNDYCQSNPFLVVSCLKNGSGVGSSAAGYLSFALNSSGNSPAPTTIAQAQQVGSVWGNAFQRQTKTLFASTFVKRHVGFGPTGIGGVYMLNMNTTTGAGSLLGSFNLNGVTPSNSATVINLGTVNRTNVASISAGAAGDYQLASGATSPNRDLDGFAKVGEASFGDIDLSEDGNTLWLVNLNQKTLIAVDVTKPTQIPTNGTQIPSALVKTYPISGAGVPSCGTDNLRPWGLKIYAGRGYLGIVCDAITTQSAANLIGYVLSFDANNPTSFTQELSIPFNYSREPLSISGPEWTSGTWSTYYVGSATWKPWAATWAQMGPQPIISDIEFDKNGNMTLGIMDRSGNQGGNDNYEAVSGSTTTTSITSAGDILRACKNGNSWVLECGDSDNNTALTPITDDGALSNDSVGGAGEFYYNDYFYNHPNQYLEVFHWEITTGALVYNPLADEVATTVFDPRTVVPRGTGGDELFRSQGVHWYNASTGAKNRVYELVTSSPSADPTTFGKGSGLGDLELLCNAAPIEIGNRVWNDADGDGIQDPGELGISGVQVTVKSPTTTFAAIGTDSNGLWYFSAAPDTAYTITYSTPSGSSLTGANADGITSNSTISDVRDSDATLVAGIPTLYYTTGGPGYNNHGLDVGFTTAATGQVDITNIAPVKLGNRLWIESDNDGNASTGTVTPVVGQVVTATDGTTIYTATTDSGGLYTITVPANKTYTVTTGLPANNLDTPILGSNTGSNPTGNNDKNHDRTGTTVVMTTTDNLSIDFGFTPSSVKLGNRLWIESDTDGNATNGTVTPVIGQVVTATDGTTIYTATTDSNGLYTITVPANTTYTVTTGLPAGYLDTPTLGGSDGTNPTGNNDKNHDRAGTTVVMTTTDNLSIDFGFTPILVKLGNRLWIESDNDGDASNGTVSPVVGQVVTATDGTKTYTATTDNNGLYTITVPANTTYTVTTGLPAGYLDTPTLGGSDGTNPTGNNDKNHDRAGTTVVMTETDNLSIDFGFTPILVKIGDRLWIEGDNDGIASTGTITPVVGQVVTATDGSKIYTATTDSNGLYTITVPANTTYTVTTGLPAGVQDTPIAGGNNGTNPTGNNDKNHDRASTTVVVTETDNLSIDFGFWQPLSLGNLVWLDTNNNGVVDGLEAGVQGVTVTLSFSGSVVATTTTDASGNYTFTNLVEGDYIVNVPAENFLPGAPLAGYVSSSDPVSAADINGNSDDDDNGVGTATTVSSAPVTLTPNSEPTSEDMDPNSNLTVDFGFYIPVSLGNRLFYDTNNDGLDNDGVGSALGSSVGIDGGVVELYYDTNGNGSFDAGDTLVKTITTSNGGYYTFTSLSPTTSPTSTYLVVITSSNFITGGPLPGYLSSTDIATTLTPDLNDDFDDNGETIGTLGQAGGVVASRAITLTVNGEPTGENNGGNDPTDDNDSNQTLDFGFLRYDFGDLPDPTYPTLLANDGARHLIDPVANTILGVTVDSEFDGQPSGGAGGDDLNGDDEDGVTIPLLEPNTIVTVSVVYSNPTAGNVYINGWIDFNQDGVMGAGEQIITDTVVATGNGTLEIPIFVPGTAKPGDVFARFRISSDSGLQMTGAATDGEVEDYIALVPPVDLGDLPEIYGTSKSANGPRHIIDGVTRLDGSVDSEGDGVPGDNANGDNLANLNDEDGVQWPPVFAPNSTAQVTVTIVTTDSAFLNAWIDWNGDGDFNDDLERIVVTDTEYTSGTQVIDVNTPAFITDTLYARFRLTDNAGEATEPTGLAASGEVEDYVLMSLGNTVWLDNGQSGGVPDNGILDGGEQGIPGVTVTLYISGSVVGVDQSIASATTDANGHYYFNGLTPGDYFVHIPSENFDQPGDPLYAMLSSTDTSNTSDPNNNNNETIDENGIDDTDPDLNGISSNPITLSVGDEPTNDGNGANGNLTLDFGFVAYDRGDLPNAYGTLRVDGGASHVVTPDLYFGTTVDAEADGQPTDNADGDDTTGTPDDEDGIVFMTPLMPNTAATISMTAHVTPGLTAYYGALIDFNGDGTFQASEIFTGTIVDGKNTLNLTVPGVVSDTVYSRFRISTDPNVVAQPINVAPDGEVEDYVLMSLGNQLWFDNGTGTGNNGLLDGGEQPVPAGVTLTLVVSGTTTPIAITTTDSNGNYLFTGLPEGDYQVIVAAENFQPGGLLEGYVGSTGQDAGDDTDNNDNGSDVANPALTGIPSNGVSLRLGDEPTDDGNGNNSNLTVDFGLYKLRVGDLVWNDLDNDGIKDGNEPVLTGVTVTLLSGGSVIAETVTDDSGLYTFTGLISGTYVISVTPPAGYLSSTPTTTDDSGNNTDHGDASGNFIVSQPFDLTPGAGVGTNETNDLANGITYNPNLDFGLWQPLSLGNRVWFDTNNNGTMDGSEVGVESVTLTLLDGSGNPVTSTVTGSPITALTDANGYYTFTDLISGTYQVQVDGDNFLAGAPLADYVNSDFTEANPNADVDEQDNGINPADLAAYLADGVVSGPVLLSAGDEPTGEDHLGATDNSTSSNYTIDFGFYKLSVGDRVWNDLDNDGFKDASEVGLPNVPVALLDNAGKVISTTTTDGSGLYTFTGLISGTYVISVTPPANYVSSTGQKATDGGNNSDHGAPSGDSVVSQPFDLTPGSEPTVNNSTGSTTNPNLDFGLWQPLELGNRVWHDLDNSGDINGNDTGIKGVTLTLLDDSGNPVTSTVTALPITTTTDAGGYYTFTDLISGTYKVQIDAANFQTGGVLQNYLSSTPTEANPDDDGDSNDNGLNPANAAAYLSDGVVSGNVILSAGDEPTTENDESSTGLADANSNLSVDFGFALWDRGDLPNAATATNSPAYSTTVADGGPSHLIIAGLGIGANEDGEADGQPTASANGDDANGKTPDDEDGVTLPAFVAGSDAVVSISVVNTTGVDAYVYGFIDFNGDGSFANNETVVVTVPGDGSVTSVTLTFTVPVDADASQLLGARFRISSDDGLDANGPAPDGEVEDYLIRVAQYDFGDLPSTLYPTLVEDDGASHAITPDLYLGASVDNEGDGQPTVSADGDDKTDTPDDEDGIVFMTPLMAGESATISMTAYVTPGLTAYYGAFIDFNGDGDFADAGEIITGTIVNGQNAINLTVPAVVSDTVYSRFRISTDLAAVSIPTGAAVDGEVEDYALMSLGNQIWFDTGAGTNNNGLFDQGNESPVPAGVTVTLVVSGTTTPISITTTDSNGKYLFTGLPEGNYQVIVAAENFQTGALLEGYLSSGGVDSGDITNNNDNGVDGTFPPTDGIASVGINLTLDAEPTNDGNGAFSNLTIDFGLVAYDMGDLPDAATATNSPAYSTTLADGGPYHLLVDGLRIGASEDAEYVGQPTATANGDDANGMAPDDEDGVILPRFIPGQPATVVVNVTNETGETAYVVGFIDFNGNGILDDGGESVVGSIDGSGNVLLTFDVPADADVTQMLGARFRLSLPDESLGLPTGESLSGEVEDYLIQMQPILGAIGNYVWLDEDADGQQDAGEPGLANVIVTMVDDNGKTYTTTTDSQGGYLFPDLPKGLYLVTVALENFEPGGALEGMEQTPLFGNDEDLGNKDEAGYVIDLDWGDENLTADFGYNPLPSDAVNGGSGLAALGDRVWIDSNGDGMQDPNEVPVAGVKLTLYSDLDGNGIYDTVVATDTTDANGNYLFDNLPAGAYVVKVTDSSTASHNVLNTTQYTQTGDPDHFGTTGSNNDNMSKPVILAPGDLFLDVDFGYQPQPAAGLNSVGDTIWFDADADGNGMFQAAIDGGAPITQGNGTVADVTDSGIAGVTVALIKDLNGNGLLDAGEPMIATDMTDSKGQYLFAGLPDGKYIVKVTDTDNVLQGLKPTWDKDSGLISPDEMSAVDLDSAHANAGSVNNRLQDFGYTPEEQQPNTALLGDTIYFDPNKDGVQQPTESGIEGVVVVLTDSNGVTQTTTTDENGHYYFAGLDPNGTYSVTVAPENFTPGGVLEGMDNTGDPDGTLDSKSVVDFTAGTDGVNDPDATDNNVNLGQDFGYAGNVAGRIGNLVWYDANADGTFDGPNGPDGILGTDDDEWIIGGVTIDLYRDLNGNGVIDAGEPKIATTVTTNTIGTGTNGADGNYIFENLPACSYVVDVTDVNGLLAGYWKSDGANEGDNNNSQSDAYAVTIGGNNPLENLTADFGYYVEPAAVGNYVWVDTNANGIQDDGESGINGVKVTLKIVYPSDKGRIVYVTTVTANDADGNPGWYSFDNLLIDEDQMGGNGEGEPIHMISVSLNQPALAAYSETVVNQGDDKLDSDLHSGVLAEPVQGLTDTGAQDPATNEGAIASYDFGYYIPASLGNYVWLDENADGVQDEGEPGLPNVTVVATNDKGDVFTTTTDSHGGYLFSDLIPGVYIVTIPASNFAPDGALEGMEQTPLNGGNDSPDLGNKDDAGYTVELSSGEENLTADFGYNPLPSADVNNGSGPAALGDRVWIDSDGDGVQDPNEVPVEGVELTLFYDPDGNGVYDTPYTVGGYDATQLTDANGNYLFDNLPAGSYVVKVTDSGEASHDVLITGEYTQTGDPDHFAKAGTNNDNMSTTPVVLAPGDLFLNVDFGYQPKPAAGLNSVGDTIWFDADGDGNGPSLAPVDGVAPVTQGAGGTADAVDYGIAGVTVALVKDENSNGIWDSGEPIIATDVTDKKGQYLFEDLPDGRYIVIVNDTDNVLEGLKPSYDEDNGTNNPDEMSAVDLDSAKAVDTNIDNRLQDFGYTPKAQNGESGLLGDTIWFDSNKDGVQNPGESGIEGVVVQLTDMDGNLLATTTTDENGHYYFAGLPLNEQYKVVVAPENFGPGGVLEGMANTGDKEGDKNNTTTSEVLTKVAPIDLTNDLGYAADPRNPVGKVGNLVWLDSNADGVWDGANGPDGIAGNDDDEPLIAGVTIDLYRDLNGNGKIDAGEPKIGSTTTTSTSVTTNGDLGNYLFDNLPVIGNGDGDPAAEYVVDVTDVNGVLAGYWHSLGTPDTTNNSQSDADAIEISVATPVNLTADFGYYVEPAAVGNYVWVDVNGDGIQNDGETGINGVAVTLKIVYPNGMTITVTTVTTDDLSGNPGYYSFGNLLIDEDHNGDGVGSEPVHTISVKLTQPALTGYVPTLINVGDDKLDSDSFAGVVAEPVQGLTDSNAKDPANTEQTIASYDFGFYQPASLGNYVWEDLNKNGIQDEGETGVADVKVELLDSTGKVISTTQTNASGLYTFSNLAPGTYAVKFTTPDGYIITNPNQGDDATDSDANRTTGITQQVTLQSGEHNPTLDAGIYSSLSLGNLVWHDANNNGQVDSGEQGIPGVTLQLFKEGDDPTTATPLKTTATDVSGNYLFTDLLPGNYFVYIPTPPAKYPASSTPTDTADNGQDNDDNGSQPAFGQPVTSPVVELKTNSEPDSTVDGDGKNGDLTIDFGFFATASLGDLVWFDSDKDGVQDSVETGLPGSVDAVGVPGVLVTLFTADGSKVATTTTDIHGNYLFAGLLPGNYYVEFAPPAGYKISPTDTVTGTDVYDSDGLRTPVTNLSSGEHDPTLDLGLYLDTLPASIGDYVWFDANNNGVQDSGESGIPGVKVTLYHADGTPVASTNSDVNGKYFFAELIPGDYYVQFSAPDGLTPTPANAGSNDALDSDADAATGKTMVTTLDPGENDPSWDAGFFSPTPLASIGDYVWYDLNADGIQDAGENGVSGVVIKLFDDAGNLVATTTTYSTGHYGFKNLVPGDYSLEFVPNDKYIISDANQGGNDAADSDVDPITGKTAVTTLVAGENDLSWDLGIYVGDVRGVALLPVSLGDRVWNDLNRDGVQDADEPGLAGVTVKLYDSQGQLIATTLTDSNGNYSFNNLPAGDYYVEFVPPVNYLYSPTNAGGNDVADSDMDHGTGRTPITSLPPGSNDPNLDAGFYLPPTADDESNEPEAANKIFLPVISR